MTNMTLTEIDDALQRAWETHRRYDLEGNNSGATVAMSYVNRLLDERLAFSALMAA